jgi:hypothetical protein
MVEKSDLEDAVYDTWADGSRAEDLVAPIKKELPLEYGDFRRWAEGLGLSIGDIAAWIDSSTHYSFATKGAVL